MVFSLICYSLPGPVQAQNLRPFTALREFDTAHFRIIFPEESRRSAEALATFADSAYERVSSLLGIEVPGRIPVTITPHTARLNAYMNPVPYPHIVLFDTPMDIEWTSFDDAFQSLFLHELVHAVSLSTRSPFLQVLHGFFGGWVVPAAFTAPLFMVEGVTVSFESLDGYGRANDPLVRQNIAQAARDGTLLDPFQASGLYDLPPNGNAYYEYGGLFSAYIQKRWGMEKYAELWKAMGSRFPLSIDFYRTGFFRLFLDVYGMDIRQAWAAFADSLYVAGLEDNDETAPIVGDTKLASLEAAAGKLYWLDTLARGIFVRDPLLGKVERVIKTDAGAYGFCVSGDGELLLLSGYRFKGDLAEAQVREYAIADGRATGREWIGLYKARFFRDGVVGIASNLHATNLVYRDAAGQEQLLLEGNDSLLFSNPAVLDDHRIALIASEAGERFIVIHDFNTGLSARLATGLGGDASLWRHARNLRAVEGKLLFSFVDDDRFYKLAIVDGEQALFSSRDFSGGVFDPVLLNGSIYYRAAFSTWDSLLEYPEKLGELTGALEQVRLIPLPDTWGKRAGASTFAHNALDDASGNNTPGFVERGYAPLLWMNPFRLWLPFPLLRTFGTTTRIDGGGLVSYLSDPTDTTTLLLIGGADTYFQTAFVDAQANTYVFGPPLGLSFSDSVEYGNGAGTAYRALRFSASLSFERGIGGEGLRYSLNPFAATSLFAGDPGDGSSAFTWGLEESVSLLGLGFGIRDYQKKAWNLFGTGFSLDLSARTLLPLAGPLSENIRIDSVLKAGFNPYIPIRTTVYGVFDGRGMALAGNSRVFGDADFEGLNEYASQYPSDLLWLAGGGAEIRIFSLETQTHLSHVYFNRLFGTLAWKGVFFDESYLDLSGKTEFVHALTLKTGAVLGAIPATALPLRYSPYAWASLLFSNLDDTDPDNDYVFGFALSIEW